jgi:hypothetical protein
LTPDIWSTYIHGTFGLIAASLRITSHNMLVMPINGPIIAVERATIWYPVRYRRPEHAPIAIPDMC